MEVEASLLLHDAAVIIIKSRSPASTADVAVVVVVLVVAVISLDFIAWQDLPLCLPVLRRECCSVISNNK